MSTTNNLTIAQNILDSMEFPKGSASDYPNELIKFDNDYNFLINLFQDQGGYCFIGYIGKQWYNVKKIKDRKIIKESFEQVESLQDEVIKVLKDEYSQNNGELIHNLSKINYILTGENKFEVINLAGDLVGDNIELIETIFGTIYLYTYFDKEANESFEGFEAIEIDGNLYYNGSDKGKDVILRYYNHTKGNPLSLITATDLQGNLISF